MQRTPGVLKTWKSLKFVNRKLMPWKGLKFYLQVLNFILKAKS